MMKKTLEADEGKWMGSADMIPRLLVVASTCRELPGCVQVLLVPFANNRKYHLLFID